MSSPPRLLGALLRTVLPDEIADAFLGDLEEGVRRRTREAGRWAARLWYWRQVVRLPLARLHRAARKLRRSSRSPRTRAEGGGGMGPMTTELRTSARSLAKRPGYSGVVVATMAVTIGAATLIFSAVEAVVMRTLPYPDSERLVTLYTLNDAWRESSDPQLQELWNRFTTSLERLEVAVSTPGLEAGGGVGTGEVILRGADEARRVSWSFVSRGVFEALGVRPALGRLPSTDELANGDPVAVVSHGFWTGTLGRDPRAVGRSLDLDGQAYTVIGVMPPGFYFPTPEPELWVPLPEGLLTGGRSLPVMIGVARLEEGVEIAEVSARLDARVRQLGESNPAAAGLGMRAVSRRGEALEQVEKGLGLFMGAVSLVVLLAAVNLANLVLARASRRRHDLALRRALGGSRLAVAWSLLAEVVLLCLAGGALGVGSTLVLLGPFTAALRSVGLLQGVEPQLNIWVLSFAAGTTLLAAFSAGLPVAWRASRGLPAEALRDGGRTGAGTGTRRAQRTLLVVESGLAFVLLAGAALLLRSVSSLSAVDPGYDLRDLHFVEVNPSSQRYSDDALPPLVRQIVDAVSARSPGTATLVNPIPSQGQAGLEVLRPADRTTPVQVPTTRIGAHFFEVAGLPLLRGRAPSTAARPDDPAEVVVSESLGRDLAPDGQVLGLRVVVGDDDERSATVVGVAADARMLALPLQGEGHLYLPWDHFPEREVFVLARAPADGPEPDLREAVLSVDPELVLGRSGTVRGAARTLTAPIRVRAHLVTALAILALLLAAVGVFAVVAHVVEERTREIGIRIALGARPGREPLRLARSFLVTVGAGTAVGLLAAVAGARLMESFLYEVEPLDAASFAAAALLLPLLGALAAWLPARRAARVDPVEVLSTE